MLATSMALKYHGTGPRSCSVKMVPQCGHAPSSPRSSSSTSASHSSHHAISVVGPSLAAYPDAQLHRRGAEVELLTQTALDVADVRGREAPAGEQCERRRVDGALDDVADACPRRGLAALQLLYRAVEDAGGHALVVGRLGVSQRGQYAVHALCRQRRHLEHRRRAE